MLVADATWVSNEVRAALSLGEWGIEEVSDPPIGHRRREAHPELLQGARGADRKLSGRGASVLLLDRSADKFLAGRAGADAFVTKPINASELREALYPITGGTVETTETRPHRRRSRPSAGDRSTDEEE